MSEGSRYDIVIVSILVLMMVILSGCVEVTPPSGTQCASAYGPSGNANGTFTPLPTTNSSPSTGMGGANASQNPEKTGASAPPNVSLPAAPSAPLVQVTPFAQATPSEPDTQYSKMNQQAAISPEKQLTTIYEMKNQSYPENATAYAFNLQNPPLYIYLDFYPVNVTVHQTIAKRTGDKEGDVNLTIVRPSSDSFFEMVIYDRDTGKEVQKEGYGKEYGMMNTSSTLMTPGNYQFEFNGRDIRADISFKIPVSYSTLAEYQNLTSTLDSKKNDTELLGNYYLLLSDLPSGWIQTGDLTHDAAKYSSAFVKPDAGIKFVQTITKCSSPAEAKAKVEAARSSVQAENPSAVLVGENGFSYENARTSSLQFSKGAYWVELTSKTVPPVPAADLLKYAGVIAARIP